MVRKFNSSSLFLLTFFLMANCSTSHTSTTRCIIASDEAYTYTYSNNKLVQLGGSTVSYDNKGRVSTFSIGSQITTKYSYDDKNHISQISLYDNTNTLIINEIYTYNSSGQMIQLDKIVTSNTSLNVSYVYQYSSTQSKNYNSYSVYDYNNHLQASRTFQYDTKNNPYYYLNLYPDATLNNVIETVDTNNVGGTATTTYDYTYNNNGYPLTLVETYGTNSPTSSVYTYANCN